MQTEERYKLKTIIDREKLMNHKTCWSCGHPFNLGDSVVLACGPWDGPPKWIHENETVFDKETSSYIERKCFEGRKKARW